MRGPEPNAVYRSDFRPRHEFIRICSTKETPHWRSKQKITNIRNILPRSELLWDDIPPVQSTEIKMKSLSSTTAWSVEKRRVFLLLPCHACIALFTNFATSKKSTGSKVQKMEISLTQVVKHSAVPWKKSVCAVNMAPMLGPVPIFKPARQKDKCKCAVQCRAEKKWHRSKRKPGLRPEMDQAL